MRLKALLEHVDVVDVQGSVDRPVADVTRDSRDAGPDAVFVAVVGARVDGHAFVRQSRAGVVVVQRPVEIGRPDVTVVRVPDTKVALSQLAAAFHGFPSRGMQVVGLTGTNGKTTIATIADAALRSVGWRTGRIGTTGNIVAGVAHETRFTTPEAPQLQGLLAQMKGAGVQAVLMEVTSIGLAQHRVDGTEFALGVFTNLTRDHLDFHGTFEAYREAKARLFRELLRPPEGGVPALLCGDDPAWRQMDAPPGSLTYGRSESCDLRLVAPELSAEGIRARLVTPAGDVELESPLLGHHNALNLAAAWGILWCLGVPAEQAARAVGSVEGVPGRLERVFDPRGERLVVVDYAHTDDALANALRTLRPITRGQLHVVFGCGGDRDAGKRPRMAEVAESLADRVVVTSDNPRGEDPQAIVDQILAGLTEPARAEQELDRARAIEVALTGAAPGDTVLVAGKGHETYQEIAGQRQPFDDRRVARRIMETA